MLSRCCAPASTKPNCSGAYVLQPYQMVKDLRTGVETSNTGAVLDGDIDRFLAAALAARIEGADAITGSG